MGEASEEIELGLWVVTTKTLETKPLNKNARQLVLTIFVR